MAKWVRYLSLGGLLLIVCLALFIPATTWMHHQVRDAQVVHDSRMAPIILVPGSSATQNRFNSLVTTLNQRTNGHSLLKVTVKTDGTVQTQGRIAPRDVEPYIVIAFENNQDGYNNIKKNKPAGLIWRLTNSPPNTISIASTPSATAMAA